MARVLGDRIARVLGEENVYTALMRMVMSAVYGAHMGDS